MTGRHTRSFLVGVAGLLVVLILPVAAGPAPRVEAQAETGSGDDDVRWREMLDDAVDAGRNRAYRGTVTIASFGFGGPSVTEVTVVQGSDGHLRVGDADRWMLGREGDAAFVWQPRAGTLLRLGGVRSAPAPWHDLTSKYAVTAPGNAMLATGQAQELVVRDHEGGTLRERLYIDGVTGLVVRRETFDQRGEPVRVVAFTELEPVDPVAEGAGWDPAADAQEIVEWGTGVALERGSLEVLARVGWAVPIELPAGFALRSGSALAADERSSLGLVYSDGLYSLSVYQQVGRLAPGGLDGAVEVTSGRVRAWHWREVQPARLVWTGGDRTFTAVSDAPLDLVLTAVAAFPAAEPRSILARLGRGTERVAAWLWPFD